MGDDEVLGFGSHAEVETFTYSVFPILTPILAYLQGEAAQVLGDEEEALKWVKTLRSGQPEVIFPTSQREAIRGGVQAIAQTEAQRLDLDPEHALTISKFIVSKL
jgi:hypothetical protein